jgi:DNA gyrase subunit A
VAEVNATGRTTQGVIFAKPDNGDRIIAVARNIERHLGDDAGTVDDDNGSTGPSTSVEEITTAPAPDAPVADETPEEDA